MPKRSRLFVLLTTPRARHYDCSVGQLEGHHTNLSVKPLRMLIADRDRLSVAVIPANHKEFSGLNADVAFLIEYVCNEMVTLFRRVRVWDENGRA
jgi:hypothetical protein